MIKHRKIGGKNIRLAKEKIVQDKFYSLQDGIKSLKEVSYAKFNETIELVMKLGIDPRHSDQLVRGVVTLPAGNGKDVKVAVICKDNQIDAVKKAGADIAGSNEIIDEIKAGKINYDVYIASPDMMGIVGSVAKILGPKGLMPNPKLGTVTTDLVGAVNNAKKGQVEFRAEKQGIIHAGVGKMNFSEEDLMENLKAVISAVNKAKPAASKGTYVKGMYLSSTMGPSLKLNLDSVTGVRA